MPLTHPLTKEELESLLPLPTSGGGGGMSQAEFIATFPLPIDTELPAAAALANGDANPTTSRIGANLLIWNGVTWDRLRDTFDNADGIPAVGSGLLRVANHNYAWNGTLWDRMRGTIASGLLTQKRPADFSVTVTGAANAIATLTLPAAGVGIFQYITHLFIKRVNTAALAGGAILTVTSTNLNGRSWRTGNQASITVSTSEGTVLMNQDFAHPLRSQVANTATTIVCPAAGAAVSWHIVCDYYIQ